MQSLGTALVGDGDAAKSEAHLYEAQLIGGTRIIIILMTPCV